MKTQRVGHRCNICDLWFELRKLFDHPEMGYICYPDKARIERLEKAEARFEWEMNQTLRNGGSL